jgi:hypothetical protein
MSNTEDWKLWPESERQQRLDAYLAEQEKNQPKSLGEQMYPSVVKMVKAREQSRKQDDVAITDYVPVLQQLYPSMRTK